MSMSDCTRKNGTRIRRKNKKKKKRKPMSPITFKGNSICVVFIGSALSAFADSATKYEVDTRGGQESNESRRVSHRVLRGKHHPRFINLIFGTLETWRKDASFRSKQYRIRPEKIEPASPLPSLREPPRSPNCITRKHAIATRARFSNR